MKKTICIFVEGIIGFFAGMCLGVHRITDKVEKEMDVYEKNKQRLEVNIDVMNVWLKKIHDGKNLADFCKRKNYKKIAIYGMNYVGERVLEELVDGQIDVLYGIDKAAYNIKSDIRVVSPDDSLEPVDAVIITPIYYFEEIKVFLQRKMDCPILSLEHMVYEM